MSIADISEVLLDLGLSESATDEERAIASTAIRRAEGAVKRHLRYDPQKVEHTGFYPQQGATPDGSDSVWEVNDNVAYQRGETSGASSILFVRHIPIRTITSLYIDYDGRSGTQTNAFSAETLKVEGQDFWPNYDMVDDDGDSVCRDGIIRSVGLWPLSPGSVKIVYEAGYTQKEFRGQSNTIDATPILESIVEEAVRKTKKVLILKKQKGAGWTAGPITNESLGDYSYSVDGSSLNRMFGSQWDITGETKERLNDFVNWGYILGG